MIPLPTCVVNGAQIEYVERGNGAPVVFVHGGLSDHRTWKAQLPAVGASHRAIAFSGRYHWPNQPVPPGAESTMATAVADLLSFLEEVAAAPAHLVGNSWGAFVCLRAAIERPDLVRSLALGEPPVLPLFVSTPPKPAELASVLLRRPRTGIAILGFGARVIGPTQKLFRQGRDEDAMLRFVRGVLNPRDFDALPESRKQQMRDNLAELRAQFLSLRGFDPLAPDEVRAVRAPVLLVTGERSPALLLRLTDALEELLPNARRVEIANASHVMHEQNPDAFNEALLDFIHASAKTQKQVSAPEAAMVIKHQGDKWVLYTKDESRVLGRHETKKEAEAQERAIQARKHA